MGRRGGGYSLNHGAVVRLCTVSLCYSTVSSYSSGISARGSPGGGQCPWGRLFGLAQSLASSKQLAAAWFFLTGSVCSSLRTTCFHSLKERIRGGLCERLFAAMVSSGESGDRALLEELQESEHGGASLDGVDHLDHTTLSLGREVGARALGTFLVADKLGSSPQVEQKTGLLIAEGERPAVPAEAEGEQQRDESESWTQVEGGGGQVEVLDESGSPVKKGVLGHCPQSPISSSLQTVPVPLPEREILSPLELTALRLTRKIVVVDNNSQKTRLQKLLHTNEALGLQQFAEEVRKKSSDEGTHDLQVEDEGCAPGAISFQYSEDGPQGAELRLKLLREDAATIAEFFASKCQNYIRYCCSIFGGSYISWQQCPRLAIAVHPVIFLLTVYGVRRTKAKSKQTQEVGVVCGRIDSSQLLLRRVQLGRKGVTRGIRYVGELGLCRGRGRGHRGASVFLIWIPVPQLGKFIVSSVVCDIGCMSRRRLWPDHTLRLARYDSC